MQTEAVQPTADVAEPFAVAAQVPWLERGRMAILLHGDMSCDSRAAMPATNTNVFPQQLKALGLSPDRLQGGPGRVPPKFHQGSTRVPPGFHQGSTRFCGVVRAL